MTQLTLCAAIVTYSMSQMSSYLFFMLNCIQISHTRANFNKKENKCCFLSFLLMYCGRL